MCCVQHRRGKDFLQFEEARELVRGIGLESFEVSLRPWKKLC
jgi:hypothetical protein